MAAALGVHEDAASAPDIATRRSVIRRAMNWRPFLLVTDSVWSLEEARAHQIGDNCVHLFTTREEHLAAQITGSTAGTFGLELLTDREAVEIIKGSTQEHSEFDGRTDLLAVAGG